MRSEFKSATQIYVNPIHFEIQLILRNYLFSHDEQNWWKKKNCPKFFHGVIFALWIQICSPNLCKSHIFWITANIENWPFFAYADLMTKIDEIEKIARNSFIGQFLRCEFKSATQIYVNPIYFELQLILRKDIFLHTRIWWPKSMNRKNCPKFFHRVIFAFWIQICNPNLWKSHTFWNTANIEKCFFFAWWPKLMKSEKLPEILS